ncbi:MAG: DUF4783 domain-containing protein [Reichenbachiella sp.]|uniref:DUF4783 domain-containing protein n=1 Tax=Reichenbachiella sp. TaxID=2184521 RepID=UPI0029675156|nr:DUF4783 domain-containing protein [Reichenbachiella sp.]MDW3208955.1 DUF4783 domain-containing protein [Reichenbachiella sp.]
MKKSLLLAIALIIGIASYGQSTTENVKLALNAGSAKELIKYFNEVTELKIDDSGANYSRIQAESVLRDFFQQNQVENFDYIHKGASPEGLKYNIGMYNAKSGTFRVVILLKEIKGQYVVDTMNFNKE